MTTLCIHKSRTHAHKVFIVATMSTWRVVVILLALLTSSQAKDTEKKKAESASHSAASPTVDFTCNVHKGGSPGHVAPTLEKDFELTVEAKIKRQGFVVLLREYYDSATRRGAVVRTHQGMTQKWIYKDKIGKEDFEYSYLIDENKRCSVPNAHMRYFAYDYMHSVKPGHFTGPSRLLKYLTVDNQEYVKDNTTVRMIPADHWKACVRNGRMELDFYFSKKTEKTPCGKRGIPLRVDMYTTKRKHSDLTKLHEFHNSYDFMFYRPGRVQDQSIFEVPKGVVCHGIYGKKVRPPAPQSFSATIVMVYPNIKFSMIRRQHFDHKAKLSAYDVTIKPDTAYAKRFGVNTVNIVHDYNTGIQYIIDAKRKNCTIEAVGKDKEIIYDFDGPWDPSHILLNHTSEIFDLSGFNLSYQGQRVERDIPVEVWAANRDGFPLFWMNTTVEVYYTQANWMSEAGSHGERHVLIGLYYKTQYVYMTTSYHVPESTHIYNYRGTQPDFSVFDVQACFKDPKHYKRVSFHISADKLTSVAGRRRTRLEHAARSYVANVTGVELLRINRLKIGKSTDDEIEVRFNLLEWLQPKEGANPAWNNRVNLDKAMAKLLDAIGSSGKEPIRLSDTDSLKNIYVKTGSLAVSSGPLQATAVIAHGYSTAALIGIGFGMVIVGGVVGLAIAFTLWKTRLLLPYFPH